MKIIISIILLALLVRVGMAFMPAFNDAMSEAVKSWPQGSWVLSIVPSPIDLVFSVFILCLLTSLSLMLQQGE